MDTDFRVSAGGSLRKQATPANSSQIRGYVDKRNREGDRFQCSERGDCADNRNTAKNLKAGCGDPGITLFTPKERVDAILPERFHASWKPPPPRELLQAELSEIPAFIGERNF
ncbi:hypothetical protein QUF72_12090 [Desulfobacterales bacterium HSG2]|nr:hypothetical protein [Desulfobacterales bacterium HSG2]